MKGNDEVINLLNEVLTSELTAINQYFIHSKMCQDWGFMRLAEKKREESIEEMKHADRVIERILYFESYVVIDPGTTELEDRQLLTEEEYRAARAQYGDRHRAGFLAEHVHAGLHRHYRSGRMPAITRGDQNGVDIVPVQYVVHFPIENAIGIAVVLVDHRLDSFSTSALQVGIGDELHIGVRQKSRQNVRASISDTDSAERDSFTRRDCSVFSEHASREDLRNCDGACHSD